MKSKVSLIVPFTVLLLTACGEEYIPLEKRVTFEECVATSKQLQSLLMVFSLSNYEDLKKVQEAANAWIRPGRREQYEKIKDVINLCSIKQAFDKEANRNDLPNYNDVYTLLVTLDIQIKFFLEDIQSEKSEEWMIWRAKQISQWLERTRESLKWL